MPTPSHEHSLRSHHKDESKQTSGSPTKDELPPVSDPLELVQAAMPAGMRPRRDRGSAVNVEKQTKEPIEQLKDELAHEKWGLGLPVDTIKNGPFISFEELISKIHENPPPTHVLRVLGRYQESLGLLPIICRPNGKILFALCAEDQKTGQIRDADRFIIPFTDDIFPYLKGVLKVAEPQSHTELILVSCEEYKSLRELVGNKEARDRLLGRIDPEASATKVYYTAIRKGIALGASDIHIEPYEDQYRVRYRVDGVLQEVFRIPADTAKPLLAIVKIAGKMDIQENRLPQDGSIHFSREERTAEPTFRGWSIRAAVLPGVKGAKAVLRLLEMQKEEQFNLDELKFPPHIVRRLEEIYTYPQGLILVTGPTGSGKTTTLYASLNFLNTGKENIVTVEDPVEVPLKGLTQVQVHPRIDLTFARAMRAFLRQDPDIILVGEIRDPETAEIAIQAGLTGHLVFATLHTNDSIGTIPRLVDLKIAHSLIKDTLRAVLSQRLVRCLCNACKEPYDAAPQLNTLIGETVFDQPLMLYRPTGRQGGGPPCAACLGEGLIGRVPVPELWVPGAEEKELILSGTIKGEALLKAAIAGGMEPLMMAGLRLVRDGTTTLDECLANICSIDELRINKGQVKDILAAAMSH